MKRLSVLVTAAIDLTQEETTRTRRIALLSAVALLLCAGGVNFVEAGIDEWTSNGPGE